MHPCSDTAPYGTHFVFFSEKMSLAFRQRVILPRSPHASSSLLASSASQLTSALHPFAWRSPCAQARAFETAWRWSATFVSWAPYESARASSPLFCASIERALIIQLVVFRQGGHSTPFTGRCSAKPPKSEGSHAAQARSSLAQKGLHDNFAAQEL